MCKVCGQPEGVHPQMDALLQNVSENMAATFSGLAQVFQARVENNVSEEVILGASLLVGLFNRPDMPVPAFLVSEEGSLVLDWRAANRILEIDVYPDGKTYEFLAAEIESPMDEITEESEVPLSYRMGVFHAGDQGPAPLADWLMGGEFALSLTRYLDQQENEDQCSDSEPGSETPNNPA